jgi:hypothetical protein
MFIVYFFLVNPIVNIRPLLKKKPCVGLLVILNFPAWHVSRREDVNILYTPTCPLTS